MNSEDIKVLEEYIKEQKEFIKQFNLEEIEDGTEGQRRIQAIENLINRNKTLEKENQNLIKQYEYQGALITNEYLSKNEIKEWFIPKSKVRKKIAYYKNKGIEDDYNKCFYDIYANTLQELLQEGDK